MYVSMFGLGLKGNPFYSGSISSEQKSLMQHCRSSSMSEKDAVILQSNVFSTVKGEAYC